MRILGFFLFSCFLLITSSAISQDLVTTKAGDKLKTKVLRATFEEVIFYLWDDSTQHNWTIQRADVFEIIYDYKENDWTQKSLPEIDSLLSQFTPPPYKPKSPAIACGLSILFPGAGQWYNGQTLKGFICFGGVAGSGILIVTQIARHSLLSFDPELRERHLIWLGLFTGLSFEIYSIFDAPLYAQKMNEEDRRKRGISHFSLPENGIGISYHF